MKLYIARTLLRIAQRISQFALRWIQDDLGVDSVPYDRYQREDTGDFARRQR